MKFCDSHALIDESMYAHMVVGASILVHWPIPDANLIVKTVQ